MKSVLLVANWKMNLDVPSSERTFTEIRDAVASINHAHVRVVVCPSFLSLPGISKLNSGSDIFLGAQTMSSQDVGAFTGEVSPTDVASFASYVILGHSERRALAHETDAQISDKIQAAYRHNLAPIVCVGEPADVYERGQTLAYIDDQLDAIFGRVDLNASAALVIAYEPIWAISTSAHAHVASSNDAQAVAVHIRQKISARYNKKNDIKLSILYGGSVDASTSDQFLAQPDIDGLLIGSASTKPDEFTKIIASASTLS